MKFHVTLLALIPLILLQMLTPAALSLSSSKSVPAALSTPDPPLRFEKTWGGSVADHGYGVSNDSSGNVYVTGRTNSFGPGSPSRSALTLLKYSSTGSLVWQRIWSGSGNGNDVGIGVAVDSSGNVYVTGETNSSGAGGFDVLLLKFDSSGVLQWQRTWGGPNDDGGVAVAVDASGNIYVTGTTSSFASGGNSILLLKYDSSGNLIWQRIWGSPTDYGFDVAVDTSGNIYVTGTTGDYSLTGGQVVLLKFDASGGLLWQKTWGGSSYDVGYGVAVDSSGAVYVSGGSASFGAGARDVLLLKFDSSGSLLWQKTWGGSGDDEGVDVAVDSSNNIYVTGWTSSFGAAHNDGLLLKFDSSGSLTGQMTWGSNSDFQGWGVTLDSAGNVVMSGTTGKAPPYTFSYPSAALGSPSFTLSSPTATPSTPGGTVGTPSGTIGTPAGSETSGGSYVFSCCSQPTIPLLNASPYSSSAQGLMNPEIPLSSLSPDCNAPIGTRLAGCVSLSWTASGAESCSIASSPTLVLPAQISCNSSLPSVQIPYAATSPMPYKITLTATNVVGQVATQSLTVYALPTVIFNPGGVSGGKNFASVTNQDINAVNCHNSVAVLGCWLELGASSQASGTLADTYGIPVAGAAGYDFSAGAEYDYATAKYPVQSISIPSYNIGYNTVVNAWTLHAEACVSGVGGGGTGYAIVTSDNTGQAFGSPSSQTTLCVHLPSGPLGDALQNILDKLVGASNEFQSSDLSTMMQDSYSIGSAVGGALSSSACNSDPNGVLCQMTSVLTSKVSSMANYAGEAWSATVGGSCPQYGVGAGPEAVESSLGFGVGAAQLTISLPQVAISGVATPTSIPDSCTVGGRTPSVISFTSVPASYVGGEALIQGRLTDSTGNPVSDHTVTLTLTTGLGSLSPTSVTTDKDGLFSTVYSAPISASSNQETITASAAGLPSATATIQLVQNSGLLFSGQVGQGQTQSYQYTLASSNTNLAITLTYPGSVISLKAISPNGQTYYGSNGTGFSQIVIYNANIGTWQVMLTGVSVPSKEGFNLTVFGAKSTGTPTLSRGSATAFESSYLILITASVTVLVFRLRIPSLAGRRGSRVIDR